MKTILSYILLFFCSFYLSGQDDPEKSQPNILWIITDDQRADALECYNKATTGKSESSLGYVMSPDGNDVLLVHRNARDDDQHHGKYNGLGVKMFS